MDQACGSEQVCLDVSKARVGLRSFVADVHAASLAACSGGVWDRYRTNHGKAPAFVMDLVLGDNLLVLLLASFQTS